MFGTGEKRFNARRPRPLRVIGAKLPSGRIPAVSKLFIVTLWPDMCACKATWDHALPLSSHISA